MKYCSQCGHPVALTVPEGDNQERFVCTNCHFIHYENPKIIAGTLPIWEDKILLCKRAIEPRKGYWTLPAGFMENGETVAEAACRETWEEALAKVEQEQLYALYSLPHINQVYIFYKANIVSGKFGAGMETLESRLFSEAEIPWDELAFPTVYQGLKAFFADRAQGRFQLHEKTITPYKPKTPVSNEETSG